MDVVCRMSNALRKDAFQKVTEAYRTKRLVSAVK